jgi:hypothetical protein
VTSFNTTGFVGDDPGGSWHGMLGAENRDSKYGDSRMKKRLCTLKRVSSTWQQNGNYKIQRLGVAYSEHNVCLSVIIL